MIVEGKLASLGLPASGPRGRLPQEPLGSAVRLASGGGQILYLSGTVPIRGEEAYLPGLLGAELTIEQGYEAARWALVQALSAIKYALGDLDRFETAIHLTGYVNSAPGFADQPRVINGATDLLVELYGERGKPTRAAIGCHGLALNSSVELVLVISFTGYRRAPATGPGPLGPVTGARFLRFRAPRATPGGPPAPRPRSPGAGAPGRRAGARPTGRV